MDCTADQTAFTRISLRTGRNDRQVNFGGVKKTKSPKKLKWKDTADEIRAFIQVNGHGVCEGQRRRRAPFVKQDSLTQDEDIEEDGLGIIGFEESQLDGPPEKVKVIDPIYAAGKYRRPFLRSDSTHLTCIFACFSMKTDYSDNSLHSQIKIEHLLQDHVLGDDFGADIESFPNKDKYHNYYCLHFFINIEQDSVAQHLTLREFDELVLLNDEFVPSMTHDELVAKFKALPVDSHTPLKLIIRRMQREHGIEDIKFQWIRIQAILVPEYDKEPRTIVKEFHREPLESPPSGSRTVCLKLQDSSKYVSIRNHVIGTCMLQGDELDNSAHITMNWRITIDSKSAQHPSFVTSLYSDQNGYLSVTDQKVILAQQPFEFEQANQGGYMLFKHRDKCLGYEGDAMTLRPQPYRFESFPIEYRPKFHISETLNSSYSSQSSGYSSFEDVY